MAIFGIFEFSRYYAAAHELQEIVIRGSRLSLTDTSMTASELRTAIETWMPAGSSTSVVPTVIDGRNSFAISLNQPFEFSLPFLPNGTFEIRVDQNVPRPAGS